MQPLIAEMTEMATLAFFFLTTRVCKANKKVALIYILYTDLELFKKKKKQN